MNILTIYIEEWYLEEAVHDSRAEFMALYDRTLERLLGVLAETGVHGTFFCVGPMGARFPHVVRKIEDAGHEIGCHSNVHTWLDKISDLAAVKNKFMSRTDCEDYYKEPGTFPRRVKRYLKDNLAWGDTFGKFASVVKSHPFIGIAEAAEKIDWSSVPKVELG